jgi:hypothetical protein
VTDLDGEVERLRAEARHRLEGERELEEKLAGYEKEVAARAAPPAAEHAKEDEDEDEEERAAATSAATGGLVTEATKASAKKAASSFLGLSTPSLLAGLVAIIFGVLILERILVPIAGLVVLAIVVLLGYRFFRWFSSDAAED